MTGDAPSFPPSTIVPSKVLHNTHHTPLSSSTSHGAHPSWNSDNTTAAPTFFSRLIGKFSSWGASWGSAVDEEGLVSVSSPEIEPARAGGAVKDVRQAAASDESTNSSSTETLPGGKGTEEQTFLARKIQALIGALVFPAQQPPPPPPPLPHPPSSPNQNRTTDPASQPFPTLSPNATLLTPQVPILPEDARLIAMLSSPVIMNGEARLADGDERRERSVSVWSVLDSMASPRRLDENKTLPGTRDVDEGEEEDTASVFSDGSSVMMYSPLIPTTASLVELAESEVVLPSTPFPRLASSVCDGPPGEEPPSSGRMGNSWPFSSSDDDAPSAGSASAGTGTISGGVGALDANVSRTAGATPRPRVIGQRVWIPSSSKLSLQVMWWGYRLYLPPPVLEILDDRQIEATKRAAVITSALTWFFGNLPVNVLPVPVRPAVMLFQTIIPYVSYIGTFISWSWGTIKSYDVGYGVVLTATWLLPVALIPSTWHEGDFPPASPGPPSPSSISPLIPPSDTTPVQNTRTLVPLMAVRFQSMALPTPASTPTPRVETAPMYSSTSQYTYSPPPPPPPLQTPVFLSPLDTHSFWSTWHLQSLTTPLVPSPSSSSPSYLLTSSPHGTQADSPRLSPAFPLSLDYGPYSYPYLYLLQSATPDTATGTPSEPSFLPMWVPPPPPPIPATIPLPEVEPEIQIYEEGVDMETDLVFAPPSVSTPPTLPLPSLTSGSSSSSSGPLYSVQTFVRRVTKKEKGMQGGTEGMTSTTGGQVGPSMDPDRGDSTLERERRAMKLKLKVPSTATFWRSSTPSESVMMRSPAVSVAAAG